MTNASRAAIIVTFLGTDEDARRATLSWPDLDHALPERALIVAWSRASGVPRSRLRRLADVLRRHDICRADGTVDDEAIKVVQHFAAEQLRGTKRRSR